MPESSIGVVVTSLDRPDFLGQALASVSHQTRPPHQVVLCNDNSADARVWECVRTYERVFASHGIRFTVRTATERLGQEANLRRGLQACDTDYVGVLHDDDWWDPTFLATLSSALDQNGEAGFAFSDQTVVDAGGHEDRSASDVMSARFGRAAMEPGLHASVLRRIFLTNPFPLSATLFRQGALHAIGWVPPGSGNACDMAMFVELGWLGYSAWYSASRLAFYRVHSGQTTASGHRHANSRQKAEWLDSFVRKALQDPGHLQALGCSAQMLAERAAVAWREAAIAAALNGARGDAWQCVSQCWSWGSWGTLWSWRFWGVFPLAMAGLRRPGSQHR
jgi:glycosyltransferase involved in cell wall biosynthesis